LLATTIGAASAQTAQDHDAHHPPAAEAAADAVGCPGGGIFAAGKTGETPMGSMGAMMDGGMGQVMQMMGGGQAMTPFAHTEGRIAFLKAELVVTDAQTSQWNAFADALRSGAKSMRESMVSMMQTGKLLNAADRTDTMVKMMSARLESMKSIAAAEKALYAVLTTAQKETADELLGGPMMGVGGSMMGMDGRINEVKP
jgi:hypothetical protein